MPGLPTITIPAQPVCLGLEPDPWAFVGHLVLVFREVRRVLRDDGVLFLNLGDTYCTVPHGPRGVNTRDKKAAAGVVSLGQERSGSVVASAASVNRNLIPGLKHKDLCGIPWRVAFALQADGWFLRSDNVWEKSNPMPESCSDRPTRSHEYVFILSKSQRYFWDKIAVMEPDVSNHASGNGFVGRQGGSKRVGPLSGGRGTTKEWIPGGGRNLRSVWHVATQPYTAAHFATWPEALVERMILAGSRRGDAIIDPFGGSGTTRQVARSLGRVATLIEANPDYVRLAEDRYWTPTRKEKATGVTAEFLDGIRRLA